MSMMQLLAGSLSAVGSDPADDVIETALVDLDGPGLSGDGATLAWENVGTGGDTYNLDTPDGTVSNLTTTTVNGRVVAQSAGAASLKSASGVDISADLTVIIAAKFSSASPSGSQFLMDARSNFAKRLVLYSRAGASYKFSIFAGAEVSLSEAYDNNPHIWVGQYSADASTKLTVDGAGSVTGNAGTNVLDYISLFDYAAGGNSTTGWIGRVLIWDDGGISDADAALVVTKLNSDFGI